MSQNQTRNQDAQSKLAAFSVHILTASGALWALLGFIAVARGQWELLFLWLGVAFVVDGIDGPIARFLNTKTLLPRWSGTSLDEVVDYTTYVLLPAFALAQTGIISTPLNLVASGLIAVTGAIYYAFEETKTEDNHFRGFPVVWNMLIFEIMVFEFSEFTTLSVILLFCILTFLPINFVHPVRVLRLRGFTLMMTFIWMCSAIAAGLNGLKAEGITALLHSVSGLYLVLIGCVFQAIDYFCSKNHKGE